jgi:hypothetical protein
MSLQSRPQGGGGAANPERAAILICPRKRVQLLQEFSHISNIVRAAVQQSGKSANPARVGDTVILTGVNLSDKTRVLFTNASGKGGPVATGISTPTR